MLTQLLTHGLSGVLEQERSICARIETSAVKDFDDKIMRLPAKIKRLLPGRIITPVFPYLPLPRTGTFFHSFIDHELWEDDSMICCYWPFLNKDMLFIPDFTENTNVLKHMAAPFLVADIIENLHELSQAIYLLKSFFKQIDNSGSNFINDSFHILKLSADSLANVARLDTARLRINKDEFNRLCSECIQEDLDFVRQGKEFLKRGILGNIITNSEILISSYTLDQKELFLKEAAGRHKTYSQNALSCTVAGKAISNARQYMNQELPYEFKSKFTSKVAETGDFEKRVAIRPDEIDIGKKKCCILVNTNSEELLWSIKSFIDFMQACFSVEIFTDSSTMTLKDFYPILIKENDLSINCQNGKKDYRLIVEETGAEIQSASPIGAMYGLFDLENRMKLRNAPYLPYLNSERKSIFRVRLTFSGLGWMEWPDNLLDQLPRYGLDSIYESTYSCITGTSRYRKMGRLQNKVNVSRLIEKAKKRNIKLYCPFINQTDSEMTVEKLAQKIASEFPELGGLILLTEGFTGGCETVKRISSIVHEINPAIEIIPWSYNGLITPEVTQSKLDFIEGCPPDTIPMVTWEKGAEICRDGECRFILDYSVTEPAPSELWTIRQIKKAHETGKKHVYGRVDCWNNWQFGTLPFIPVPFLWKERYDLLRESGIDGVLETWTSGFMPNFISELRYWDAWSNGPEFSDLLNMIAEREFGVGTEDVINAWRLFGDAVKLLPDTGHGILCAGTAAPMFFKKPEQRIWVKNPDEKLWKKSFYSKYLNPYWPYCPKWAFLFPDFSNVKNMAELYAKSYAAYFENKPELGEKGFTLKTFLKYMRLSADKMEEGLALYRRAAMSSPENKKENAFRHVLIAETMKLMILSTTAVLEFEDYRFQFMNSDDSQKRNELLDKMARLAEAELDRTKALLEIIHLDSRIGYEWENDYFYTDYTLKEKIRLLENILGSEIPEYKKIINKHHEHL